MKSLVLPAIVAALVGCAKPDEGGSGTVPAESGKAAPAADRATGEVQRPPEDGGR